MKLSHLGLKLYSVHTFEIVNYELISKTVSVSFLRIQFGWFHIREKRMIDTMVITPDAGRNSHTAMTSIEMFEM